MGTQAGSSKATTLSKTSSSEKAALQHSASEGATLKVTVSDTAVSGKSAVKGGAQVSKPLSAISKKTVLSELKTKISKDITPKGSKQPGSNTEGSSVSVTKLTGASPKVVKSPGEVSTKPVVDVSSTKLQSDEVPSRELAPNDTVKVENSDNQGPDKEGLHTLQDRSDEGNDKVSVTSSKSQPDDVTKRKPSFESQRYVHFILFRCVIYFYCI